MGGSDGWGERMLGFLRVEGEISKPFRNAASGIPTAILRASLR